MSLSPLDGEAGVCRVGVHRAGVHRMGVPLVPSRTPPRPNPLVRAKPVDAGVVGADPDGAAAAAWPFLSGVTGAPFLDGFAVLPPPRNNPMPCSQPPPPPPPPPPPSLAFLAFLAAAPRSMSTAGSSAPA